MPTLPIILRKLTLTDVRAYKELRLHSLVTDPNAYFLQHAEARSYPDSFFLGELKTTAEPYGFYGAFMSTKLIGMISLQHAEDYTTQIFTLYVHPEWRGKGIGKSLLSHCIQLARSSGLSSLRLTVTAGNPAASLYESLGFKKTAVNTAVLKNKNGTFDQLVYQIEI